MNVSALPVQRVGALLALPTHDLATALRLRLLAKAPHARDETFARAIRAQQRPRADPGRGGGGVVSRGEPRPRVLRARAEHVGLLRPAVSGARHNFWEAFSPRESSDAMRQAGRPQHVLRICPRQGRGHAASSVLVAALEASPQNAPSIPCMHGCRLLWGCTSRRSALSERALHCAA